MAMNDISMVDYLRKRVKDLEESLELSNDMIEALNELVKDNKSVWIAGYLADSQHGEHSTEGAERAYKEWVSGQ